MRAARLTPPLVLAVHGSRDPRFARTVDALAAEVAALHPSVDVRVGHLDHGPPLTAAVTAGCVVVPVLLARGFHALVDVPRQAPGAVVTAAVGPDRRLALALADRLLEAGYAGGVPVTLVAAGSTDPEARDDVRTAARHLAERLGAPVAAAYLSGGRPRLSDLQPVAVATYLLAPGRFADQVAGCGAAVVAAPVGAHPAVAQIVASRYAVALAAQVPGRTAPA